MMRSYLRLSLALALGLIGVARQLHAQQTYDACYVPSVGALYLIKQQGLPTDCLATSHVPVSWTEGGVIADGSVTAAKLAPDASTAIDHGMVAGLGDDDHTQYLTTNGVRDATDGFAVTGTIDAGVIPIEGAGVRLMWYPRKAALRAGQVQGPEWDDANVGSSSIALGVNPIASGDASTALGDATIASGFGSTALGSAATSSGQVSTALGSVTIASGVVATAMGNGTIASGGSSTAMGNFTTASAFASTAMGNSTSASGDYSTALGVTSSAQAYASLVIGRNNVFAGDDPTSWVSTDPLFVAGNGTSSTARSNALTLLKDGNLTIAGTLTESSDIRLKEEIEPLESTLDGVLRLTPISYRFRNGTGHPTERQIGLSAQEVDQVFPELVRRDADGYLSVAYTDLAAVLVRAIQEQQTEIALLRTEIAALRSDSGREAKEQ